MEKDRDQLTPADPEDREHLRNHRGQGTAGSGIDEIGESGSGDGLEPDEPREEGSWS